MSKNSSCSLEFSEHERQTLLVVRSSVAITSMVTCIVAVALWVFFRLHKRFPHRLFLYLLASALFNSFAEAMSITVFSYDHESDFHLKLCSGVGFLDEYSSWGLLLFSTEVTFHLSYLVLRQKKLSSKKVELFYILFPVLFPCLFVWIPFIFNAYGLAGAWCWIRKQDEYCNPIKGGWIQQLLLWYVPYFILTICSSVFITIVTIILCKRSYVNKHQGHENFQENPPVMINYKTFQNGDNHCANEYHQYRQTLKETLPLLVLPVVFFFLGWLALAHRIFRAVTDQSSIQLALAHAIASPLLGCIVSTSFIIHLLQQRKFSKNNIYRSFHQWCKCALRHQGVANNVSHPVCKYSATDASYEVISESAVDGTENQ